MGAMKSLRVLNLMGNPVRSKVNHYRKTLTIKCRDLQHLDDRPVFPRDRACAEAWHTGGDEAEEATRLQWIRAEQKRINDSVDALIRMRDRKRENRNVIENNPSEEGKQKSEQNEEVSPENEKPKLKNEGSEKVNKEENLSDENSLSDSADSDSDSSSSVTEDGSGDIVMPWQVPEEVESTESVSDNSKNKPLVQEIIYENKSEIFCEGVNKSVVADESPTSSNSEGEDVKNTGINKESEENETMVNFDHNGDCKDGKVLIEEIINEEICSDKDTLRSKYEDDAKNNQTEKNSSFLSNDNINNFTPSEKETVGNENILSSLDEVNLYSSNKSDSDSSIAAKTSGHGSLESMTIYSGVCQLEERISKGEIIFELDEDESGISICSDEDNNTVPSKYTENTDLDKDSNDMSLNNDENVHDKIKETNYENLSSHGKGIFMEPDGRFKDCTDNSIFHLNKNTASKKENNVKKLSTINEFDENLHNTDNSEQNRLASSSKMLSCLFSSDDYNSDEETSESDEESDNDHEQRSCNSDKEIVSRNTGDEHDTDISLGNCQFKISNPKYAEKLRNSVLNFLKNNPEEEESNRTTSSCALNSKNESKNVYPCENKVINEIKPKIISPNENNDLNFEGQQESKKELSNAQIIVNKLRALRKEINDSIESTEFSIANYKSQSNLMDKIKFANEKILPAERGFDSVNESSHIQNHQVKDCETNLFKNVNLINQESNITENKGDSSAAENLLPLVKTDDHDISIVELPGKNNISDDYYKLNNDKIVLKSENPFADKTVSPSELARVNIPSNNSCTENKAVAENINKHLQDNETECIAVDNDDDDDDDNDVIQRYVHCSLELQMASEEKVKRNNL